MRTELEREYVEYVTVRLPRLHRIAYLLCSDSHQADDIVQAALTSLYLNWKSASRADNLTRTYIASSCGGISTSGGVAGRVCCSGMRCRSRWPGTTTVSRSGTRCRPPFGNCRRGSGRCWCCAFSGTCRSRTRPRCSAARSGIVLNVKEISSRDVLRGIVGAAEGGRPHGNLTPLDAATRSGATDLVVWLRENGARTAAELAR